MKIKLLVVGKTTAPFLREGEQIYSSRLSRYIPFELCTLPDLKTTKSMTPERQKELEGDNILNSLKPGEQLILLDERGKEYTSREFATMLQKRISTGASKGIVFCVGGPYGFSKQVYDRADAMISLSRMTFSHEMVRTFFIEQLYRAFTILNNEPYHHD